MAAVKASNLKLIGTVPLSDSWGVAVSPDSSTLYVANGEYPDIAMTYVDAATLQVTPALADARSSAARKPAQLSRHSVSVICRSRKRR